MIFGEEAGRSGGNIDSMSALVTGVAGFIGSHVAEELYGHGWSVVGIDNFDPYYPRREKEANLREMAPRVLAHFEEMDIRDPRAVGRVLREYNVDVVVHLAAKAGVRPSIAAPAEYMDVNARGTAVLLEACRAAGVAHFVFASSSSVYGAGNTLPFREDQPVQTPMSPYAASKIAAEALCYTYHHLYGLPVTCLRLFTVYGPRQRPDLAINKFVRLMLSGRPVPMYGDGSSSRDYTFIRDIADGVRRAVEQPLGWAVINLGSSNPVALRELIRAIETVTGVHAQIQQLPPQPGDMPHTYADVTRAEELLGWQPRTSLEEGLRAFVEWWKSRQGAED